MSHAEILRCLDLLAATTGDELTRLESLEREVAVAADSAASRLTELATLRNQIIAASAIAAEARPSPLRRHRPSFRVTQVA